MTGKRCTNKKCLIAYYSCKGNNYADGSIVNLPIGNIEVIAKKIKGFIGGDLFEINTVIPYPLNFNKTANVVRDELSEIVSL